MTMYYVGIDVGGTNLKAGLVGSRGEILKTTRQPLEFTTPEDLAATLAQMARTVIGSHSLEDIACVGIGIPGAVEGGTILYTANIPLENVEFSDLFRQNLELPVFLANDADCAAAGEYLFGCGRGSKDFVIVTLGTGVGGGMILGGRLHTGRCCAGEVGHMVINMNGPDCACGRQGCWESCASATALIRMAREAAEKHPDSLLNQAPIDGEAVFRAADRGDEAALSVVRQYQTYLAVGLTNLVNILQPEIVAIGGGIAHAPEHLLLDPVARSVKEHCYGRFVGHYPKIVCAQLGNDAGIAGAALIGTLL